jgi:hypothetical protein
LKSRYHSDCQPAQPSTGTGPIASVGPAFPPPKARTGNPHLSARASLIFTLAMIIVLIVHVLYLFALAMLIVLTLAFLLIALARCPIDRLRGDTSFDEGYEYD